MIQGRNPHYVNHEAELAHALFGSGGQRHMSHEALWRKLEGMNVVYTARDRVALLRALDPKRTGRVSREALVSALVERHADAMYAPGSFMSTMKNRVQVDVKAVRRAFREADADGSG